MCDAEQTYSGRLFHDMCDAEQTYSGRLFQRERAQDVNALAPASILMLGTNRMIPLFDLSEPNRRVVASKK